MRADRAEERIRRALTGLPTWARHHGTILFAAAPAQRLFAWHDALPAADQRPYSATWRPVLDAVWEYAGGDDRAYYPISHAMGHYYLSPQSHVEGQDGPNDADQDEVAATFFAANCVLHGLVDFALLAAGRATDAIDNRWYGIDEPRLRAELRRERDRQAADLAAIVHAARDREAWRPGAPPALLESLRATAQPR